MAGLFEAIRETSGGTGSHRGRPARTLKRPPKPGAATRLSVTIATRHPNSFAEFENRFAHELFAFRHRCSILHNYSALVVTGPAVTLLSNIAAGFHK